MIENNNLTDNKNSLLDFFNVWFWLSIIEFLVIMYLLFLILKNKKNKSSRNKFKNEALKEDIDFNNIINSSFNSKKLYDELKVKCHPDRFPNDSEKNLIAENIFQEITKNKNNIKKLNELKDLAISKLNINFK